MKKYDGFFKVYDSIFNHHYCEYKAAGKDNDINSESKYLQTITYRGQELDIYEHYYLSKYLKLPINSEESESAYSYFFDKYYEKKIFNQGASDKINNGISFPNFVEKITNIHCNPSYEYFGDKFHTPYMKFLEQIPKISIFSQTGEGQFLYNGKIKTFADLIIKGGQVSKEHLIENLNNSFISYATDNKNGEIVAICAIKKKTKDKRQNIFSRASLNYNDFNHFNYELGYCFVENNYRGFGIIESLIYRCFDECYFSNFNHIFSTTGNLAMEKILLNFGFLKVGESWRGNYNYNLQLYIYNNISRQSNI